MTLEQKQLNKVQPLNSQDPLLAAGHDHRINPKTGRRRSCPVCRLENKKLRAEREGKWLDAVVGVSKELIREGARVTGQVGAGLARAHGTAVGAWLGNPDPVTWLLSAGATYIYINWITELGGDLATRLGLPDLGAALKSSLPNPPDVAPFFTGSGSSQPPPPTPDPVPTTLLETKIIGTNNDWVYARGWDTNLRFFQDESSAVSNWDTANILLFRRVSSLWKRNIHRWSDNEISISSIKVKDGPFPPRDGDGALLFRQHRFLGRFE